MKLETTLIDEIWKNIVEYEGVYQISNKGNVRNTRTGRKLKVFNTGLGYMGVNLCLYGKYKTYLIHRLVGVHFVPNPYNKPEVNHIDEDKVNNNADNLEWCTRKENINHGTRNTRASKNISKKVICLETGKVFDSVTACAKYYDVSPPMLSMVLRNKRKNNLGVTLKYLK